MADNGPGLDSGAIEKIFDPFYTTKFTGRGLGLAVVLGLVRSYEGVVSIESTPEISTVFRAYLPLAESGGLRSEKDSRISPQGNDGDLVLVVDDESEARNMVSTMLEQSLGYQAIVAGNGFEAMEIFREHKDEIQLIFLDLGMQEMDGWQTLAALREIRPGVPVIMASGLDDVRMEKEKNAEVPQAFLYKPYTLSNIKEAIALAGNRKGLPA